MPLWQVLHCARTVEDDASTRGGDRIEATGGRRRRGQTELIGLQRRQLRRDQIVRAIGHVDPGAPIRERSVSAHLRDADIAVPIRDVVAVAGGRDAMDAARGRMRAE